MRSVNMRNISDLRPMLQRGLIVSCQPVPGSPMDKPEMVAAMACAAMNGGAAGLRIEGVRNLLAVRQATDAPIIGIIKRDLADTDVRITPWLEDVDALSEAGADIIAFDVTLRSRPVSVEALYARVRARGCLTMADASCLKDGLLAHQLGFDFIGTTLSGYTGAAVPAGPDIELVKQLAKAGCLVIAEGRYNSPVQAAEVMAAGAFAVTVGSAITRIEHICGWYRDAINPSKAAKLTDY